MKKPFLKLAKLTNFGAFSNKVIGPFTPHLNVVYGENEAGKTTLASFVGGVLFGWEDARGNKNTYKPTNAERAGSLFFAEQEAERDGLPSDEVELSRIKNADGLQGDATLVADIDKDTFQTMFFLTSDELRSLKNTNDVTAKLLTAGSGTENSPAQVLEDIKNRLREYTSTSALAEHSLVRLASEQAELRSEIAVAGEEADRFRQHFKELYNLEPEREKLSKRLEQLNVRIETLNACRAHVEKLDDEQNRVLKERSDAKERLASLQAISHADTNSLLNLSEEEDRSIRNHLEELATEETKAKHSAEVAKDAYLNAKAAHEALTEGSDAQETEASTQRKRTLQAALSVIIPVVFLACGLPLIFMGQESANLSLLATGIALAGFAAVFALVAFVLFAKPNKEENNQEARIQESYAEVLQEEKRSQVYAEELTSCKSRIAAYLQSVGLQAAEGSLSQARNLLDDAKEVRTNAKLAEQRKQEYQARLRALDETLATLSHQRTQVLESAELEKDTTAISIAAEIARKVQMRQELYEQNKEVNRRYGELKQELSQAVSDRDFDELKLQYQQLRTRSRDYAQEYAKLLLAKAMLETAIAAWESKSQPEVYKQAGRFLSLMTGGKWIKVSMEDGGKLIVSDATKTSRSPLHLSLGTCQQVYLSLRIALLLTADNVGRAIPILADDILVNFDAKRRQGAAQALAELAQKRQVILFTCHEEILDVLRVADKRVNVIRL